MSALICAFGSALCSSKVWMNGSTPSVLGPGIGRGLLVAILDGEIERGPALGVGQVDLRAVIDQESADVVKPVLDGDQQRTAAIHGGLIHIGTRRSGPL